MKKYLFTLCLALFGFVAFAQQRNLSGTVVDNYGEPLPGVNVVVKGTTTGVTTDFDGNYVIQVRPKDVLVFSFIGYNTQEQSVGNKAVLNVRMEEDQQVLDDVVVVGYGVVKKSDLTSSISTIKGDEIVKSTTGNAMNALQGKVNGVQVASAGSPGAAPKILVRGVTTVNGSDPLYVVDGMPISGNINFLNNNDIESMEVLKDASASAIYGTRGSNGVILITTKKGKAGNAKFNFSASAGFQTIGNPNVAGAAEYEKVYTTRYTNDNREVASLAATTTPTGGTRLSTRPHWCRTISSASMVVPTSSSTTSAQATSVRIRSTTMAIGTSSTFASIPNTPLINM